ncbi:hypothetical protein J4E83_010376 [Alternaria metachromatica]|uniref:uncharacterized protein n=1 Tax=Alternaria metachromatica TaxID=283354 RepID=UPI0020C3877D|nr:uncharacterized protein J4E83_010376 [Alternaria metachromatica]KAI4605950.1 hypothetical protein J4E83_010376 [Alternaria metachromatica]
MAPKIFLTGGTGYIGGSVLHTLYTTHPSYSITVLLRRTPETFTSTYPNITILTGSYTDTSLITSAAASADIVVHNGDSDHEPSLSAIISGLLQRSTPGYLLHLSGTGIVSDWASPSYLGVLNPRIWSDKTSLGEIRQLPPTALHRNTETILHDTIAKHGDRINIAIMCPPDIYGKGKGLVKTHSALIPFFIHAAKGLESGKPFYYNEGANTRSWVHINDLMRLYLHVVEAAASSLSSNSDSSSGDFFNENGYYFAATQEHSQIDVAKAVGGILHKHGVIKDAEPVQIGLEELDGMANYPGFPKLARYLFASNSRTRAERAGEKWGYKGEAPGLLECLEGDVLDAMKGMK